MVLLPASHNDDRELYRTVKDGELFIKCIGLDLLHETNAKRECARSRRSNVAFLFSEMDLFSIARTKFCFLISQVFYLTEELKMETVNKTFYKNMKR